MLRSAPRLGSSVSTDNGRAPALVPCEDREVPVRTINLTSFGGECTITTAATAEVLGRFWIDVEFEAGRHPATVAVLSTPDGAAARLRDAGALLLHLDDGRQLRGRVSTILKAETLIALSIED